MRSDIVSLRIEPGDRSVQKGTAIQLSLLATNARGGTDLIPGTMSAWSSSDAAIVEITRQGRFNARGLGTATITVHYGGQVARAVYEVVV